MPHEDKSEEFVLLGVTVEVVWPSNCTEMQMGMVEVKCFQIKHRQRVAILSNGPWSHEEAMKPFFKLDFSNQTWPNHEGPLKPHQT